MRRTTLHHDSLGLLGACALVLTSALGACAPAAEEPAPAPAARAQATDSGREVQAARSLSALAQVVSAENYQRLGFHSAAEASQVVGDAPVAVYMVRLDQLRAFKPAEDPGQLLVDLETAVYPLRVHGEVHTAMELAKRNGVWETQSYGSAPHAHILDQVRRDAAAANGVAEGAFFEVRVSALNSYFLGHRGPKGLMLTPMLDSAAIGLKAGESRPAAEVFLLLQPLALRHNGQAT